MERQWNIERIYPHPPLGIAYTPIEQLDFVSDEQQNTLFTVNYAMRGDCNLSAGTGLAAAAAAVHH